MPASPRTTTWLATAVLAIAAAGAAFLVLRSRSERAETPPPVLAIERDGLRWTYHLPSGTEALFDTAADPRCLENLADRRPDDARRLREEVERREEAPVERLREHYREQVARLRALGYL